MNLNLNPLTYALQFAELDVTGFYVEPTPAATQSVVRLSNGYGVSVLSQDEYITEVAVAFWPSPDTRLTDWEFADTGEEQVQGFVSNLRLVEILREIALIPNL